MLYDLYSTASTHVKYNEGWDGQYRNGTYDMCECGQCNGGILLIAFDDLTCSCLPLPQTLP